MGRVLLRAAGYLADRWRARGPPEASSDPALAHAGSNVLLLVAISAELCSSESMMANEKNHFLSFCIYPLGKLISSRVRLVKIYRNGRPYKLHKEYR